jgi:transketolase
MHFGVREHGMGAALTGISLNGGLIPFGATFMCFSDYMKPAIRLASLSEVQVIFIFTHDSIGLGEDGPTHQPIEHLAGLRAIPHLYVIRPADPHETREAWRIAIKRRTAPTALVLTRQKVPVLDQTRYGSAEGVGRGAYVLADAEGADGAATKPALILIATGSEVSLALEARDALQKDGTPTRVVSIPCWELFEEQEAGYRNQVLPPEITARLAIEAGSRMGWDRYVGPEGGFVCIDRFGASSKGDEALRELGFNVDNVVKQARRLLGG